MCRLAYIPAPKKFPSLVPWLADLEKSFGGHGNGVAMGLNVLKGVDVTVEETAMAMARYKGPALWHTRRISSGKKCDDLCHPFETRKGWLAHNGHWHDGDSAAGILSVLGAASGPLSDSRVFSLLVDAVGFSVACKTWEPSGVWMYMTVGGKLSAWKSGGSLWYSPSYGAWGSEPSKHGFWYEVLDGLYLHGEKPKRKAPPFSPAIRVDTETHKSSRDDLLESDWQLGNGGNWRPDDSYRNVHVR